MGGLNRARYVRHRGNSRSPVGREPHGDGALVVVRGRESRPHGEGGQVVGWPGRGGTRHAGRRDDPGHHPKGHRPLESRVRRKSHARFGGGRTEKDAAGCPSLLSHHGPVNEPRHKTYLAGRLPYLRDADRPAGAAVHLAPGVSSNGRFERRSSDGFEPRRHLSPSHWGGKIPRACRKPSRCITYCLGLWDWATESTCFSTPFRTSTQG